MTDSFCNFTVRARGWWANMLFVFGQLNVDSSKQPRHKRQARLNVMRKHIQGSLLHHRTKRLRWRFLCLNSSFRPFSPQQLNTHVVIKWFLAFEFSKHLMIVEYCSWTLSVGGFLFTQNFLGHEDNCNLIKSTFVNKIWTQIGTKLRKHALSIHFMLSPLLSDTCLVFSAVI